MCKVLNKAMVVYVGRGSAFGNPFVIGKDGNRADVIAKYIKLYEGDVEFVRKVKRELKGKDLVCYCAPSPCHADWLLLIANS